MRTAELAEQRLKDLRKAASFYELLTARFPRSPRADDALTGAARCYEGLRDFDRAVQLYRELLQRFPASEYRRRAEDRIKMIEVFESKDKDAGLEKLALLLGDVVAEKDKVGLAFRLGEIYFNELKNYPAAATQFTNAINSGMSDSRFVTALFLRAKAYEYMNWKDNTQRPIAIEAYQTFLSSYPADGRSEDAALALFNLSATTPASARTAYESTMAAFPRFARRDELLLQLGMLQNQADSLEPALSTFTMLAEEFGSSRAAEDGGYHRILLLLKLGLRDSAMAAGTRYLSVFPDGAHTAALLSTLADLLLQSSNGTRAVELFQRLSDDFSYSAYADRVRRRLADALAATGNFGQSVSIYAELLEEESSDPLNEDGIDGSLLLSLGTAQHMAGDPVEAKKALFQFLALGPSGRQADSWPTQAAQAYNLLGIIHRSEGSLDLATSYFRQAASIAPGTAASREIADLLFESGNYGDALKQYAQLAQSSTDETDREFFEVRTIISQLRNDDLGGADKGIRDFASKHKKSIENLALFDLERGNYYFRKEDYAQARRMFERVVSKYGESAAAPTAMYWTGKTLEATDKGQEALKHFDKLIEEYPTAEILPRVYFSLGNIYYRAERWDESARYYKLVLDDPKVDPGLLPFAMNNLIETYEAAGIYDEALSLTRRYLDMYPNSEDSFDKRIKIGILYQRLGYNDQSVLHLQTLLDEAGSDLEGEIRYYIAEANFNKGDYQQAILDFLKVPYLVTKKGKIDWTANSLYMSGQSYEKMGRYDQALTMYQQIIDRPGIDETFKSAAKKEIDRVRLVLKKRSK
jgi:tetratricopeptide (TPR) repeat protein